MKKVIFNLVLACAFFAAPFAQAQDPAITKGDLILDIGIGLGDIGGYHPYGKDYTWSYNNSNGNSRVQIPTLSVSLQKAFFNDVTIGGQFAMNVYASEHDLRQSDGYYQHSNYTQTNMFFLGRGEYHFNRLIGWGPKADLYAGALAGVRASTARETNIYEGWGNGQAGTWRNDYPNRASSDVGPSGGVFGGIRYFFAGNMSIYAEAGIGLSALRAGFAWRL